MLLHTQTVILMHSVCATDKVLNFSILDGIINQTPMTGILCGECGDGKGVSVLLNDCVSCHDAQGLLILGLSKFSDEAGNIITC